MSRDDEDRFRPRPGRIRSDARGGAATKSFFTRVRKIARQHGAGTPGAFAFRKSGWSGGRARGKVGAGRGVRRGRGAAFVRGRTLGERGWSHRQPGARRVIVKSRSVRAAGKNGRAAAHLRYIQRDGTSRDGERGRLYAATQDRTDGDAFLDRGKDDRHQFRVIVSPEDGAELGDLTGFTRDLMSKLEGDLGTKLDWVAVNHFNTGHPHVHVIINGRDELGEDLVINGDYIAHGIRERASELVTLELGPVTEIEQRRKLAAEIDQDRFTRIDRALIAEAGDGLVDLRHAPADPRGVADRALRLARLGKLEGMGLASEPAPGRWQLSEKLEPTLRELGERGDIIKTMHKALGAEGRQRDPASFWIHDGAPATPIVGRVIDKHLSDELGENLTLIIDGIDGRTHHVPGVDPAGVEVISLGSIAEIRLPEAGRRRIVERIDADHWRLPQDFESKAAAYDAGRNRQINIRVLSTFDLERQIEADGATWLDRRLVGRGPADLVAAGFGQEVQQAMDRRREHLIGQGDAIRHADGRILYRRNLLAALEQRDVIRSGTALAASRSLPFRAAGDGETVQGVFKETVQLSSGKFALVENAHEFTLVPWRPVIENRLGREVVGVVQGGSVSWHLGRKLGLGL